MPSQTKIKRELRAAGDKKRFPWPRAPRHGKHTDVQGFPNNRGLSPQAKTKKK